jgi:hypothetical protein
LGASRTSPKCLENGLLEKHAAATYCCRFHQENLREAAISNHKELENTFLLRVLPSIW